MPSKELWTDFAILMIGCVPALTAVCVIFFLFLRDTFTGARANRGWFVV